MKRPLFELLFLMFVKMIKIDRNKGKESLEMRDGKWKDRKRDTQTCKGDTQIFQVSIECLEWHEENNYSLTWIYCAYAIGFLSSIVCNTSQAYISRHTRIWPYYTNFLTLIVHTHRNHLRVRNPSRWFYIRNNFLCLCVKMPYNVFRLYALLSPHTWSFKHYDFPGTFKWVTYFL